ncbi:MAG: GNAT family N-acetyltransferase [Planctomycetes bacterium]|nr:GNAT family N-acetyltransferase [Planctomycetota bacterium]
MSAAHASCESQVVCRPSLPEEAPLLARIMDEAIDWGRLRELGPGLSRLIHEHFVRSPHALCVTACDVESGDVLGYMAGSIDNGRFQRSFLWRRGWLAALFVAPRLLHPRRWAVAWRCLAHFGKGKTSVHDDPSAEALSFAVRTSCAGRGVGRQLFRALCDAYQEHGVQRVKFGTVATTNEVANAFYQKMGCEIVRTESFYADTAVHVYVLDLESTLWPKPSRTNLPRRARVSPLVDDRSAASKPSAEVHEP